MNKEDDVLELEYKAKRIPTESELHHNMKLWCGKHFLDKSISVEDINFEVKLDGFEKYKFTAADVFISTDPNIAIYCQANNPFNWLYHFLEDSLPIARNYAERVIVAFPKNIENVRPFHQHEFVKELRSFNVEVLYTDLKLDGIQKPSYIYLSSEALNQLSNLKEKVSPNKTLIEFIEEDLKDLFNDAIISS